MASTGQFSHRFLQAMDGPEQAANVSTCISACLNQPVWRLSLQTHKISGIR
jgi:organic radical activating enzyme